MSSEPTPVNRSHVEWGPVARGAMVGLCLLVAASIVAAILDHNMRDFDDSGWKLPLFVVILIGYGFAGFVAGRATPDSPYTNSLLAGLGAFVLWIPVRIVIWLLRDEHKGLFTGHSPILRPGQVFGQVVIAAAIGMFGGWLSVRVAQRARD